MEEEKIEILSPKQLTDDIIDKHIEEATFIVMFHHSRKRRVRKFIDNYKEDNEKIVYVHIYPKDKKTLIGNIMQQL